MAINDNVDPNLHTCKMQLYEHHFEHEAIGKYIARPLNERTLNVEEIIADMISLDGFTGSKDTALDTLRSFTRVVKFRLEDGFKVNDGRSVSYLQLTGTFNAPNESPSGEGHRMVLKHLNTKESREFAAGVKPDITGIAAVGGQIYYLRDTEEEDAPHNMYMPGNMVIILGDKIKVVGDNPGCGVFFAPVDGSTKPVKMTRIAENTVGKIIGIAPETANAYCRIQIVTQYAGGSVLLKEPRTITSDFQIDSM